MDDKSKEFNDFFNETASLFRDVTSYAVLLEKLSGGKVELTAINELRSVLYHLYGFIETPESKSNHVVENYHEAKEHLWRAYYDVFSMICAFLMQDIQSYEKNFDLDVIHKVFPDYFSKISPELVTIAEKISHVRTVRQTGTSLDKNNIRDNQIVALLLQWNKELKAMTNVFVKYQNAAIEQKERLVIEEERRLKEEDNKKLESITKKKKDKLDMILRIAIPAATLLIGWFLNHYLVHK